MHTHSATTLPNALVPGVLASSTTQSGAGGTAASFPWLAFVVLASVFLLTEHDCSVSLHDAYTQSQDQMEAEAGGGSIVRRFAFLALAGCGIFGMFAAAGAGAGRGATGHTLPLAGALGFVMLLFLGWCTLSVVWSDEPDMTLRRLSVAYCFALGATGIGLRLTTRQLAWLAMCLSAVMLAVGFASELALGTFRPWSADYRFSGSQHPNIQGLNLATLCLSSFCLWRAESGRKPWLLGFFAVGFLFLFLTKSRTSCAGVLLALSPLWLLRAAGPAQSLSLLAGGGAIAAAGLVATLTGIDLEGELGRAALLGREEQAESLTGRLPIWNELAPLASDRLWLGYGYDSFWTPARIDQISNELQWAIREAHSAYLDTILSTGFVGLLLLLSVVALGLFRAGQRYLRSGEPAYGFLFGLLLFGLVNAGTESIMQTPLCVPFLLVCGMVQLALTPCVETRLMTPHPCPQGARA